METWKKFAIIFAVLAPLLIIITLLAVNFQGWGTAVSKTGGPFFTGLFNLGAMIPKFMLQDGYRMAIGYLVGLLVIPLTVAYLVWHFDIGYKLGNASKSESPASGYDNTMSREPAQPEKGA